MSGTSPSRAIKLFGTEETVPEITAVRAGALSAEFEGGKLRYIRIGGAEALRGVAFVVRGPGWETFSPALSDLLIEQTDERFLISYAARISAANGEFGFRAEIEGRADGTLRFEVRGKAETDFETNRTGFVILHPVEGVAGRPCKITHGDGSVEETAFPDLVMPLQPFFDIRAMAHEVSSGLWITCAMEGADPWESEDQRNWTDASYKTYYRPLALPFPYTIAAGEDVRQTITLSFDGPLPRAAAAAEDVARITLGAEACGAMPRIGLGVPAHQAQASREVLELAQSVGPQLLVCEFDPRQGHGEAELAAYGALSQALGTELVLEIVVPCERAVADELAEAAAAVAAAGLRPDTVLVEQAGLLKFTLQTVAELGLPSFAETYAAARKAFPDAALGGGVFTNFTELNRNRPTPDLFDFISHTTCAVVHEVDDRSVMETLQSLPSIIASVRAFAGGKPYRIGPSAIGMRSNPYGLGTHDNQANVRMSFNQQDPRHRGLLGAAFTLGYVARLAYGGLEAVTIGAPVGEFGMAFRKMTHPQPWFDDIGGAPVFPLYHVVAGMAAAAGAALLPADSTAPERVLALAYRGEAGTTVWLANLTSRAQRVALAGLPDGEALVGRLDEANFERAASDPHGFAASPGEAGDASALELGAYAVARIAIAR